MNSIHEINIPRANAYGRNLQNQKMNILLFALSSMTYASFYNHASVIILKCITKSFVLLMYVCKSKKFAKSLQKLKITLRIISQQYEIERLYS